MKTFNIFSRRNDVFWRGKLCSNFVLSKAESLFGNMLLEKKGYGKFMEIK